MTKPSVLVIGAGMGGIVAATHLAHQGFQVTVLEKNDRPGGRCSQFERDGHAFDTGPTLLVMPKLFESEFETLGTSMWDALDLIRVDPTYHLVFDDGSQLALTSDQASMRAQLESMQPGGYAGFIKYLNEGRRHYDSAVGQLVKHDFRYVSDVLNPAVIRTLMQVDPLSRHYEHMRGFFDEPRLKAAFTFQDVYMGLSPFEAPATFSMMSFTELVHGVYYPRGGMYKVIEAAMKLALAAGVRFEFDIAAERIEVEGERATGVLLADGSRRTADVVLANADLPYVYNELLPAGREAKALARKRYSCSTISFFWGVDKVYAQLPPHTLFLADEYSQNFDAIEHQAELPENPSLYVHAPARLDPAMAPRGQDTLIAIVPVGHLSDQPQDWHAFCEQARQQVFRRLELLGIYDLKDHIKFEVMYNPLSWRKRYNLVKGSTHGLSHNLMQLAFFRPGNRHKEFHNLYFVGASTRPGTGLPTAMVSGRLAAERIMDEWGD